MRQFSEPCILIMRDIHLKYTKEAVLIKVGSTMKFRY